MTAGGRGRAAQGAGASGLRLTLGVAAAAFAVDQALKWWIVQVLDLPERGLIDVAPPFLRLVMAWNTGANFGLGAGLGAGLWMAVAAIIATALAAWSLRMTSPLRRASAGLVIGGAAGNALDRAVYGAVADFLNMSCCGLVNPYAFNVADIAIFAGAFGLILFDGSDKER